MVSAWRNFKNIFSRPLFTIIFRPEMLRFRPYSILTGDTMVRFVIFCVLSMICPTFLLLAIWKCHAKLFLFISKTPDLGVPLTPDLDLKKHTKIHLFFRYFITILEILWGLNVEYNIMVDKTLSHMYRLCLKISIQKSNFQIYFNIAFA